MHASFHQDGHRILTVCRDGTARLWDVAPSTPTASLSRALFSSDGSKFLVQSNGWLQAVETRSNKPFPRLEARSPLQKTAWSSSSRFLLRLSCGPQDDTT